MQKMRARYEAQVRKCAAENAVWLAELTQRHSPFTVIAALTEHIGGALFLSQAAGKCSHAQAREIIQRVHDLSLADTGPPPPSPPQSA